MHRHPTITVRRWIVAVAWGLAGVAGAAPAAAQDDASEAARALLIDEARAASARGDHQAAASLAERALAIEGTASLRLFLAEQWIALGRDVEALAQVERCRREANSSRRQEAVVRHNCDLLRGSLVARLSVLQLRVEPEGATATVNGRPAPTNGAPFAVPAGVVTLRVTRDHFAPHEDQLTLARAETRELTVSLHPLPAPPAPPTPRVEPPIAVVAPAPPRAPSPSWRPSWSAVAWMASGFALLTVATPLLVWQRDGLASRCARTPDDDLRCPDDAALREATTANEVLHPAAIATGVLGGVSLLLGAVWWWRASRTDAAPWRVSASPRGLAVAVAF